MVLIEEERLTMKQWNYKFNVPLITQERLEGKETVTVKVLMDMKGTER